MDAASGLPTTAHAAPLPSEPAAAGRSITRVLVAMDQGPLAARALDVGAQIAAACGAEVALVHVIDPHLFMGTEAGVAASALRADFERDGRALLAGAAEHVEQVTGLPAAFQFLEYGRPAHEIVRVSGEWMADLVVLGTHGRSAVSRALLGSTSEGVLCHGHRPVLIVPPAE